MPKVSALIVTWNSADTIEACLASLPDEVEVIVVDNGSTDQTTTCIRQSFPGVTLIESTNLGFATGCNLAASYAEGDAFLLLNPDASLAAGALGPLLQVLADCSTCGAVAPRVTDPRAGLELSWGEPPGILFEWRRRREQQGKTAIRELSAKTEVAWVSGACMLVRREAWESVGGFDEGFFLYFEDLDLCRRLREAGWTILYEPASILLHERGHSAGQISAPVEHWYRTSQLRYYDKHRSVFEQLFLRGYLLSKYLLPALTGKGTSRAILRAIFAGKPGCLPMA